jgi:hypothetical protein
MSAGKIWSGFQKWIGVDREREEARKFDPAALQPGRKWCGIPRFRSRKWHPDIRMRRGIEKARELKQRGTRLARILASQLQGIEVRNRFRADQLADRRLA